MVIKVNQNALRPYARSTYLLAQVSCCGEDEFRAQLPLPGSWNNQQQSAAALDLLSRKLRPSPTTFFFSTLLASVNIATTYLVTQLHLSHRMVYHETQSSRATQLVYPETQSSRGQTTGLPRSPVLQWPYNSQECSDSGGNSWSTKASLRGENHMLLQRLSNASSLRFTQLSPK